MRLRVLLSKVLVLALKNALPLFLFRVPTGSDDLSQWFLMSSVVSLLAVFKVVDRLLVEVIEV